MTQVLSPNQQQQPFLNLSSPASESEGLVAKRQLNLTQGKLLRELLLPKRVNDESKHIQMGSSLQRVLAGKDDNVVSQATAYNSDNLLKIQESEVERIQRQHQQINQRIQSIKNQILGKRKPEESGLLTVIDLEGAQKVSAADMNNQVDGGFTVPLNLLINQNHFGAQTHASLYNPAARQTFFPPLAGYENQSAALSAANQQMSQSGINGLLQQQRPISMSPTSALEPTIQELKNQIFNRRLATAANGIYMYQQEETPQIHQQKQGYAQQQIQSPPNDNSINAQLSFNSQVKTSGQGPQSPKSTPVLASPSQLIQQISEVKVESIKQEILTVLPLAMQTDSNFFNQLQGSQLNRLLLDYFVHSELSKKKSECASPEGSSHSIPTCAHSRKGSDKDCSQKQACQEEPEEFDHYQQSGELTCNEEEEEEDCGRQKSEKVMLITRCPHTGRKHYAKNMCSSCYRKYGRSQNASRCPHTDRMLYSMGMCQTCYLADYHKRRIRSTGAQAAEERSTGVNLIKTSNQSAN